MNNLDPFVVSPEPAEGSNHERNQQVTVYTEPVEGIDQRFLNYEIKDEKMIVTVVKLGHRRHVYRSD